MFPTPTTEYALPDPLISDNFDQSTVKLLGKEILTAVLPEPTVLTTVPTSTSIESPTLRQYPLFCENVAVPNPPKLGV